MGEKLEDIARQLHETDKKVQLIYAFNGTGKTRLSRALKDLVAPKMDDGDEAELSRHKILYYNAFTEDLFYWDNDLQGDGDPKLIIQPNSFTDWIIRDRGQDQNIIENFQRYTDDKLTPSFKEERNQITQEGKRVYVSTYPEVTFSFDRGTERTGNLKISKGEESNFIWSVFYTLLEEVVGILQEPDASKRDDDQFDQLEYVFIDDPVSSLDENHLIELAVNLAGLIKSSRFDDRSGLKFIVTTHNPLFYNVLHNELSRSDPKSGYRPKQSTKYQLRNMEDGSFQLDPQKDASPFSYHLFLLSELQIARQNESLSKYHFNFLRNIFEKTSIFLGGNDWKMLLPKADDGRPDPFAERIVNLSSHSDHSTEEVADLTTNDKEKLGELIDFLTHEYGFPMQEEQNG